MPSIAPRALAILATATLSSLGLIACGDDDTAADTETTEPEEFETADAPDREVVEVTLADYQFRDLPDSVDAGTRLSVENVAEAELHELVAFRLPDDENRSVEELMILPPDELTDSLGEPSTVLLATPGGPQIPAIGDGTLTEPGRYAVACFIPIGIEPDVYLQAAEETEEGPPPIEGAGPPHFTAGMFGELTVK